MSLITIASMELEHEFAQLWLDFLTEDLPETGILPGSKTMGAYLEIYHRVCLGEIRGVALLAQLDGNYCGVLLQSEPPAGEAFDLERKNLAYSWGSYVKPARRGYGVMTALWDHALDSLKMQGIEHLGSEIPTDSKIMRRIAEKHGVVYTRLRGFADLRRIT